MYSSYSFSTSALDGGECSASRPGRAFTPGERTPGTHCTGGWVGPRAGLDTEAKGKILCPRRGSNPDRPVVHPVFRHYTAWANRTPVLISRVILNEKGLYFRLGFGLRSKRSRVSSDSIVPDHGLDDRAIGVRSPSGAKNFSSSLCVQTGSEAHPASCTMGTGGPFPGGKAWPGRDADHSPLSSADVNE
jgi:hypothetical protein